MRRITLFTALVGSLALTAGCERTDETSMQPALEEVAGFEERQVTGVAVSSHSRIFVNFPRWSADHDISVAEVSTGGSLMPYPDEAWNGWQSGDTDTAGERFVNVQSVHVDAENNLWALDTGSPGFAGVIPGGAKLVKIDLSEDRVARVIPLGADLAPESSYLNDVRIDTGLRTAYMTDSNLGALVILDLESGEGRRVLEDHPSTHAEPDYVLTINEREVRTPDGAPLTVQADGIALSPDRRYLYYHALTGRNLYRVETEALRDESLSAGRLGKLVEDLGETVATDGMLMDAEGTLYLSALERNAIVSWTARDGLRTMVQDPRIQWPDSFALGPEGDLFFTTSQLHRSPLLGRGDARTSPYGLWRIPAEVR